MRNINPIFLKDFYKVLHYEQYPQGTTKIISNMTPRASKLAGIDYAVVFGINYLIKEYLVRQFNENFFSISKRRVMKEYRDFMKQTLGVEKDFHHIAELHDLGHLPIEIYALPEGTKCPIGVPMLVIYNTMPTFYWLTNTLETLISCVLWNMCTAATTASQYRALLDEYALSTSSTPAFVDWQAHDFSFRGMSSIESAATSGAGHLLYFKGTDNIPAIHLMKEYYGKDLKNCNSVAATEHSVMCSGGCNPNEELATYKRLINEVYPSGIVSIVSDTWDFWKVVSEFLPQLKDDIMKRDGKVVIRPDSGDPVKIICGDVSATGPAKAGMIQQLWEIFGGTTNRKGFKELDSHIGAIYGDSITPEVAKSILHGLEMKGFASTNIIFGVGSYSYQYKTRDSLGFAIKATAAEINGELVPLFKNPKTDSGVKKSARGLLMVRKGLDGKLFVKENINWPEFYSDLNELKKVF